MCDAIRARRECGAGTDPVFVSNRDQRLSRDAVEQIVRKHAKMASAKCPSLREELEYNLKLQNEIYRMKTWPFSPASIAHFAIAFWVDAIPAFQETVKLLTETTSRKA